jgi:hypothetical protein
VPSSARPTDDRLEHAGRILRGGQVASRVHQGGQFGLASPVGVEDAADDQGVLPGLGVSLDGRELLRSGAGRQEAQEGARRRLGLIGGSGHDVRGRWHPADPRVVAARVSALSTRRP